MREIKFRAWLEGEMLSNEQLVQKDRNWLVSENPYVAVLVDAANILRYGKKFELY